MEKEIKKKEDRLNEVMASVKDTSSVEDFTKALIWKLAKDLEAVQGAFFKTKEENDIRYIVFVSGYAYHLPDSKEVVFEFGEGLSGQVAKSGKPISISKVPDGYIKVVSGLGQASPSTMLIYPIINEEKVEGVIELAGFKEFGDESKQFLADVLQEVTPKYIDLLRKEKI